VGLKLGGLWRSFEGFCLPLFRFSRVCFFNPEVFELFLPLILYVGFICYPRPSGEPFFNSDFFLSIT